MECRRDWSRSGTSPSLHEVKIKYEYKNIKDFLSSRLSLRERATTTTTKTTTTAGEKKDFLLRHHLSMTENRTKEEKFPAQNQSRIFILVFSLLLFSSLHRRTIWWLFKTHLLQFILHKCFYIYFHVASEQNKMSNIKGHWLYMIARHRSEIIFHRQPLTWKLAI